MKKDGRKHFAGGSHAPELAVHERVSQSEEVRSTKEKKNTPNSLLEEDTEETRKWRGLDQNKIQCWKKLMERMEEEVLDKHKVEDSEREAHRGRGSLLEWRRARRSKK